MTQNIKIAVVIVAGGNGSRMGSESPKQYIPIHGKMILRHTIETFLAVPDIALICCVAHPDHKMLYQQAVEDLDIIYAQAGSTRQESVYSGLKALKSYSPDFVLIHDAARPCLTPEDIHKIIHRLNKEKGLALASPVAETLQRNFKTIDRDNLWSLQTPQAFPFSQILACHEQAAQTDQIFTDDTSLWGHCGFTFDYVPCGKHNVKITTQDDLMMAEQLLKPQMETRTAMGFDVHAFDDTPASLIRLGGIDIPFDRSLKGHSDADVGLHALTDAIFGALADGDIGSHFPPSNPDFKAMDSHIFLDKAVNNLKTRGGQLIHVDITFMCEDPKIGKVRGEMQDHLAAYLKLSTDRVSIKATTTEKLGFTGRKEGIACQAIVTVELPKDQKP